MYYKAVLLDLDDTLYSNEECHSWALSEVCHYYSVAGDYDRARREIKESHPHTHDRAAYFYRMCQNANKPISLSIAEDMCQRYWQKFYERMLPFPGVIEFLQWHIDLAIPTYIVTNFPRTIQEEKLRRLGIASLISGMVTCDDIGVDKPDSKMFLTALLQLGCQPIECMMIGDSYDADILGARSVGIQCTKHFGVDFINWLQLVEVLQEHYRSVCDFRDISKYCGERLDLVQAAGGNVSVKLSTEDVIIKTSGTHMADVSERDGFVLLMDGKVTCGTGRPSIEASFHRHLDARYVIHVHPVAVIGTPPEQFKVMFPNAHVMPYIEPGVKITEAIPIRSAEIIYLQNHGLILSGNDKLYLIELLENICARCETHLGMDLSPLKAVTAISQQLRAQYPNHVSHRLPFDIRELQLYTPDIAVYVSGCIVSRTDTTYVSAPTLRKCRDIADVLIAMTLLYPTGIDELSLAEIERLTQRPDEQYRIIKY